MLQFVTNLGKNVTAFCIQKSVERKKLTVKIRAISFLLALILLVSCVPTPASASAEEISVSAVQNQIKTIYRQALRRTGRSSFHGYCGTIVGWQIYLLGIDTSLHITDGNEMYDLYSKSNTTSGGYRTKKYPASSYTLEEALNAITNNGTKNAYNIMVGFQRTNTTAGRIYGHAVMIHAIIDGRVYFMECYNMTVGGKYWAEGSAVSCTIKEFCNYYNRWTTLEGVLEFGLKNYAGVCLQYPSSMQAIVESDVALYAEPCDPGVYDVEPTEESLTAGQTVKVTALLQTPGGSFWYELDCNGTTRYVRAEYLDKVQWDYDDVQIADLKIPTTVRKNKGYVVKGNLSSQYGLIQSVEMSVYTAETEELQFSSSMAVGATVVSLSTSALEKNMTFRNLPLGTYQLHIRATMGSYVLEDGEVVLCLTTLELKNVQFEIISGSIKYYVVTFDATGGTSDIDQTVVYEDECLETLPEAKRDGYVFLGWTLDEEGKQPVSEQTVLTADTTLYAQWEVDYENIYSAITEVESPGWHLVNGSWHYHPKDGWFVSNGYRFYQLSSGELLTGWQTIAGQTYYFSSSGVQLTGWQKIYGDTYYLYAAGGVATGSVELDGVTYQFDENGILQEG